MAKRHFFIFGHRQHFLGTASTFWASPAPFEYTYNLDLPPRLLKFRVLDNDLNLNRLENKKTKRTIPPNPVAWSLSNYFSFLCGSDYYAQNQNDHNKHQHRHQNGKSKTSMERALVGSTTVRACSVIIWEDDLAMRADRNSLGLS